MKRSVALTISIFIATLVLCVGALPAWGQGENPPADTKEVGQTSGHGVTLVELSAQRDVEQQIRNLHDQGREAALKGKYSASRISRNPFRLRTTGAVNTGTSHPDSRFPMGMPPRKAQL
jgi:Spy/CpxP family protein refolding chaperone